MRCYVLICGALTVLVASTLKSATDPRLVNRLKANGITKMMLLEVPVALVQERYGEHFAGLAAMLGKDDIRIVDFNGASVFRKFSFSELGEPLKVEF